MGAQIYEMPMAREMQPPGVRTPQFRTLLVRKFANLYPGCTVVFDDSANPGISFRLFDGQRNPISRWVRIYRSTAATLKTSSLQNLLSIPEAREDA